MFTGTMIDELIRAVETAEWRARIGVSEPPSALLVAVMPPVEAYRALAPHMYDLTILQRAGVGVA